MAFPLEPLSLDTSRVAGSSEDAEKRLLAVGRAADKAQDELIDAGRGADRAGTDLRELGTTSDKTSKKMSGLSGVARQLFAGFSVAAVLVGLKRVASFVVETGKTFEVLQVQLATAFGSQGAGAAAFKEILEFAKASPGQVTGITAAWIGLKSIGIDPTIESMRALDDVASSSLNAATGQARKLEDLAEAVRGAVTGETERLKAFNIIARQHGETMTLTYKDTSIKVRKSAQEIMDAIVQIGATHFPGAAERQMDTLAGKVSNLDDAWDSLANTIFQAGVSGMLKDVTDWAIQTAMAMEGLIRQIGGFSGAWATARSVVATVMADIVAGYGKLFQAGKDLPLGFLPGMPSDEELGTLVQNIADLEAGLREVADDQISIGIEKSNDMLRGMGGAADEAATGSGGGGGVRGLTKELEKLLSVENILRNVRDVIDRMFREPIKVEIEPIVTGEVRLFGDRGSTSVSPGRLSPVSGIASTVEEAMQGAMVRVGDEIEDRFGASFEIVSRDMGVTFEDRIAGVGQFLKDNWQGVVADIIGMLIDGLRSGDIGGALEGIGAMAGGIFGSTFGPIGEVLGQELGALAGEFVGDLLGFGESLEDAYSTVIAEGGQLLVDVQQGGGEVAALVDDILGSVLGTANSIIGSLGGSIDGLLGGFALQINMKGDEIREIKAYIDGVAHIFQTVEEAVDALVGHVLSLSATSGLDPEVQAILREAAGKPLDQINAEVAAAIRVAAGRMGADVAAYRDQVRAIFADFATVFSAGGDAMAGTLGRLRDMWDAATGQQQSAEEIFEGRKRIILAEIDLEIARLEAEQRALQAEADQAQVAIAIDEQRLLAHHEILRGEAHVVQATADFAGQLVAIANVISELELLRGEIAITPFRPPSIPGVGRPSGGLGPRVDVEAIEREIALAEARAAGNDELVEAILLEEQMADLRERGWTQEQIDRLLAAQEAQEALAEEAAELARQEEEAARQAAELRQQIDDLFGQLEAFGDGRSGASGQIQDAIDQMQAMWDALNELRPEDLSPEELAAASEQIQNAIRLTAEEITRIGTDLVTGTLAGALRTAIERETDPRERLRLQEELFELERALGTIKRQAAIAELAQVEALMRLQGLWTAELEEQSNRAIELLSEPWPDFVAQVEGAGRTFAATVGAASAGTPQDRLFALIDKVAALGVETGQLSPFDALRDEVSDFMGLFPEFSDILSGLMTDIDELEFAARLKEWADTIGQVQDRLRPGGDLMIGQSNRDRLASLQGQISAAIQAGDFQTAAQLASTGLDVAGGTSSRIFGEFASFVEGLSLDQFQAETSAEIAETQRAGMLNAFEQAAAQRQQQHGETENNRLMQTQEISTRFDLLAGTVRAQTSMLERMASQHEEIYHA